MTARPIKAKSVLIRRKTLDSWFLSRAGMNLYRGCAHDCLYCDGRSEIYRVEGDFARDVVYKENAVEILTRELDPRRRRKPFRPGYVFLGGGVSDSWQPVEEELRLTRRVLELFRLFPQPLLLLTKSSLILRDLDLLVELDALSKVTVAVSLSSTDEDRSAFLESGASPPAERLEVIRRAKAAGLSTGVMVLPVVPLITDRPEVLDATLSACVDVGADFACVGSMTLKPGRQSEFFLGRLETRSPDIAHAYGTVYGPGWDRWGSPSSAYFEYFAPVVHEVSLRYGLPRRIPAPHFPPNLTLAERAAMMLFQMDGVLRDRGLVSTYSRAARSLSELSHPLEDPAVWRSLRALPGMGSSTERLVKEILDTGSSKLYEKIIRGGNPSD